MTASPETIKLYLPFGDPARLRIAEFLNRSMKAVAAPRSDLAAFFSRDESAQAGVYVLAGSDNETDDPIAYIGQASRLRDRIRRHVQDEPDFWNRLVAFVSTDDNLTKAHTLYLEGAIIEAAEDVGRVKLKNNQASGSRLPESERAGMDVYLSKVRQLLPILGFDLLTPRPSRADATTNRIFTTTILKLTARGAPSSGGFIVYKGSQAVRADRNHARSSIVSERQRLMESGVLIEENGHFVFAQDVEFPNPSRAAGVVKGGSTNGRTAWKDADGRTLKELEVEDAVELSDA